MPEGIEHSAIPPTPRLLLVEDNPLHVRLVRTMINDVWPGFDNLDHVARLDLAVRRVADLRPDCVLLDLVLPDADGLESVRAMLAAAPAVPIVVLSAHDDEATAAQAIREGAQDYLVKGNVTADRLSRAIRFAIERYATSQRHDAVDLSASVAEAATAVLDVNGSIIVAHPDLAAMLRRSLDQIVAVPLESLSRDVEAWQGALDASTGEPTTIIVDLTRGDDTSLRCRVDLSALADESGETAAFVARYQPITSATSGAQEPALSTSA
jgi:DNA-binding NarL/FixJ family response regulator